MSFLREAMGGEKITFGGNYETRWAVSEKKAVKVIINHHGKIVKALEDLSMDTSFRPEVRQQAVGLVKQLSNKNVMLIFYFFYDVLDVIETSSLQFQKRYGLLVDQCKNIEDKRSTRQMLWFSTVVISHKIDASINNAILSFISNVLIFASMSFSFSTYTPR